MSFFSHMAGLQYMLYRLVNIVFSHAYCALFNTSGMDQSCSTIYHNALHPIYMYNTRSSIYRFLIKSSNLQIFKIKEEKLIEKRSAVVSWHAWRRTQKPGLGVRLDELFD